MKRFSITLSILSIAIGLPLAAGAQPMAADVDTSEWACEYCRYEEGFTGSWLFGLGYVNEDAFKFADYTGLESGLYGVIGVSAVRSGPETFWRIRTSDLGLDSRDLLVEGGKPGTYDVYFEYDEIPRYLNATGRSPFANPGSGDLQLVSGWTTAPMTNQMPLALLQPFEMKYDRDRIGLGFEWTPPGQFEYDVSYSRDSREGTRSMGGGFMFTTALLPTPVDYVTDSVEAGVTYLAGQFQARLAYHGSFFENDTRSLTWENPFNPVNFGATSGQFDLGPDNESHLVSLTGNYRGNEYVRMRGSVSVGETSQDDRFLPYTVNMQPEFLFGLQPLPADNLDGKVDLLNAMFKIDTDLMKDLDFGLTFRHTERDNETPQRLYAPVTQDLYVNPAQRNRPYSYEKRSLDFDAHYRYSIATFSAGAGRSDTERVFGQRLDTEEDEFWGRVRLAPGAVFDATLEAVSRKRDGVMLDVLQDLEPSANPLLRKFFLADRDRDEISLSVSVYPREWLQVTYSGRQADDDYDRSEVGLTYASSFESTLDVAAFPNKLISVHAFYSLEDIEADIVGSSQAADPDWFAETDDTFRTFGVGVDITTDNDLELSVDYVHSDSDGEYRVRDGSSPAAFPTLVNELDGFRMRLRFPLSEGSDLFFDYYHEEYDSSDWQLDGVEPSTVFNLLSLGEDAHNYEVDTLSIWYRKGF